MGLPSAFGAVFCFYFSRWMGWDSFDTTRLSSLWLSYNVVLSFLIVFRSQLAYARFWEGSTLLLQVRGEWFNATSSLLAFCSRKKENHFEVERFQHLFVRLMSMLICAALQ